MKITRRQLRQIIKEEVQLIEKDQGMAPVATKKPDYSESDPDKPFPVSMTEFERNNQKEIKEMVVTLKPVAAKVLMRVYQNPLFAAMYTKPSGGPSLKNAVANQLRQYIADTDEMKILDEALYLASTDFLYQKVMGKQAMSIQDVLGKAKKLAAGGAELDKLMDEVEMALTSDSYTGEDIVDKDAIEIAVKAFIDNVGL